MPFLVVLRLRVVVFLFPPLSLRIFAPHALAALDPFFNDLGRNNNYFRLFSFFAYFLSLFSTLSYFQKILNNYTVLSLQFHHNIEIHSLYWYVYTQNAYIEYI